jgi:hypothetical protein
LLRRKVMSTNRIVPKCVWPPDLQTIGLTPEDKSLLEERVSAVYHDLPLNSPGCIHSQRERVLTGVDAADSLIVADRYALIRLKNVKEKNLFYDLFTGERVRKKRISSPAQHMVLDLIYLCTNPSFRGVSVIKHIHKMTYYETCYPNTLGALYYPAVQMRLPNWLPNILSLQEALRALHDHSYQPAHLCKEEDGLRLAFDCPRPCYHGYIHPNNIGCEPDPDRPGDYLLRLCDWTRSVQDRVSFCAGWESPETVRFISSSSSTISFSNRRAFNIKHGQARDVWSFALLVGSLLRGSFFYLQVLATGSLLTFQALPSFDFITKRMEVTKEGEINDEALWTLTQGEVDADLDNFLIALQKEPDYTPAMKTCWECVKKWLRVNPDERPTLANCYISL